MLKFSVVARRWSGKRRADRLRVEWEGGRDRSQVDDPDEGTRRGKEERKRNNSTKGPPVVEWSYSERKRVTIKRRRVQVHVLLSQGFKARTDATVDPHEKRLQLSHFGNELEKTHDGRPIEVRVL